MSEISDLVSLLQICVCSNVVYRRNLHISVCGHGCTWHGEVEDDRIEVLILSTSSVCNIYLMLYFWNLLKNKLWDTLHHITLAPIRNSSVSVIKILLTISSSLQFWKFDGNLQQLNLFDIAWTRRICFPSLCVLQLYE